MDKARDTLTQASHKLAEQMYKAAQPQTPPTPGAGPAPDGDGQAKKDEGVIDAEYVDVEDKK
jgi:molecular chaperone DnaK